MGNRPSARHQGWRVTSGEPDPATVERLLRKLPSWFGIESSVLEYIESARRLPAYLAWPQGPAPVGHPPDPAAGVLLAMRHFPRSAEIYLMAVDPAVHRQGAGGNVLIMMRHGFPGQRPVISSRGWNPMPA